MLFQAEMQAFRSIVGGLQRSSRRDWATAEAAAEMLRRAPRPGGWDFPRETLAFLYEMLEPLSVQAAPLSGATPGPRMLQALKVLGRQPTVPADVVLEVAAHADALRGNFTALAHTADDLAAHAAISSSLGTKGRTMFNLVRAVQPAAMLELGTAYGISATFMLRAQARCGLALRLTTVEGFSPQKEWSEASLKAAFGDAVTTVHGLKAEVLPALAGGASTFDFLFHDGGHVGDAYVDDFESLEPVLRPGAIVAYDDIRFDQDHTPSRRTCHEGWLEVTRHPRVRSAYELGINIGLLELR